MTLQWHVDARALRSEGWKIQAIARHLNRSDGAVSMICKYGSYYPNKPISNDDVLVLWKKGCDTQFIAHLLNCSEAAVYNRLARLRGQE